MQDQGAGDPAGGEDDLARSDREWAAQATPPAVGVPPVGVPPVGAGGAGVGGAGGSGGRSDTVRPRGPKPISGPKRSGIGCFAGLGLLGLLVTVAIIGVLAARSMSDVSDSPAGDAIRNRPGASSTVAPDGGSVTPGAGDSPQEASCVTERSTIETAAQAFELTVGSPPPDVRAIVDAGLLVPTDVPFRHEIGPDGAVVGTGACAGG